MVDAYCVVTGITRFSPIPWPLPTHRALLSKAAVAGAARRRGSSGDAEKTLAYAVTGALATRRADHVLVAAARATGDDRCCLVQRSAHVETVRSTVEVG